MTALFSLSLSIALRAEPRWWETVHHIQKQQTRGLKKRDVAKLHAPGPLVVVSFWKEQASCRNNNKIKNGKPERTLFRFVSVASNFKKGIPDYCQRLSLSFSHENAINSPRSSSCFRRYFRTFITILINATSNSTPSKVIESQSGW